MEYLISQMAKMHGITRQTLIYYDKIGLFHPARTDENGVRYYTAEQMPFLREICLLRNLEVPISEIHAYLEARNKEAAVQLFDKQLGRIREARQLLDMTEQVLQKRKSLYESFSDSRTAAARNELFTDYIPERHAFMIPWKSEKMDGERLHLCYVDARERLNAAGLAMGWGFGALFTRGG